MDGSKAILATGDEKKNKIFGGFLPTDPGPQNIS